MGNKHSSREQEVQSSRKDDDDKRTTTTSTFTPSTHTLSPLKADKSKGYTFTVPKNTCWDTTTEDSCIGGDEFGERKFVPVDKTRCLLQTQKGKTEVILLRNYQTQTIHVCSFTPPGNEHGDGHPLFEWGVIGKSRKRNSCTGRCKNKGGYTMTTPFDGSYSVRGVNAPSPSSSSNRDINSSKNSSNSNSNNTMVVTSSINGEDKTCATFEETDDTWECHTMYGIDPTMMVCFIVALDTLRTMKKQRSGSVISIGSVATKAIGMRGNSSNSVSRFSLLTSSKSSSSNNGVGNSDRSKNSNKMTNSSTSNSSNKMLGYSKRNSNGSYSYPKSSSRHDMPPITSFINNARAA